MLIKVATISSYYALFVASERLNFRFIDSTVSLLYELIKVSTIKKSSIKISENIQKNKDRPDNSVSKY